MVAAAPFRRCKFAVQVHFAAGSERERTLKRLPTARLE